MIGVNKIKLKKLFKRRALQPGFSLTEILVSVLLFALIITGALNVFRLVIESQRTALATQNVEENLKYFLEVTSKEIRMAKRSTGTCGVPVGQIYANEIVGDSQVLKFKNYHGECVVYDINSERFRVQRGLRTGFLTPASIKVTKASFLIKHNGNLPEKQQGMVVMSLTAEALGKELNRSEMKIQTTLTSRYYRND
jgi:prepilin-type N-terminal cleavage/methylation domain-containing protein